MVSKEERLYSRYSPQLCFTNEFRVKCIKFCQQLLTESQCQVAFWTHSLWVFHWLSLHSGFQSHKKCISSKQWVACQEDIVINWPTFAFCTVCALELGLTWTRNSGVSPCALSCTPGIDTTHRLLSQGSGSRSSAELNQPSRRALSKCKEVVYRSTIFLPPQTSFCFSV